MNSTPEAGPHEVPEPLWWEPQGHACAPSEPPGRSRGLRRWIWLVMPAFFSALAIGWSGPQALNAQAESNVWDGRTQVVQGTLLRIEYGPLFTARPIFAFTVSEDAPAHGGETVIVPGESGLMLDSYPDVYYYRVSLGGRSVRIIDRDPEPEELARVAGEHRQQAADRARSAWLVFAGATTVSGLLMALGARASSREQGALEGQGDAAPRLHLRRRAGH